MPKSFMDRVGGPLGLFQLVSQINRSGIGSTSIGLDAIGAVQRGEIPLNPTQQQYGEMLRRAGVETAGGGGGAGGGASAKGGGSASSVRACPESDPETTPVSEDVQSRIDTFESRVRIETAPLGTLIPQRTWLELQSLSFKTPEGIRLARQLLWYVKAMRKGKFGESSTKFRYNNRIVDLLDAKVEPSSFNEVNAETPLFGEHIASRVSNSSGDMVIGSPFSSEETWEAIRTIRKALRGAELTCQRAKGLPGDAWKAFEYFVKGVRGFSRLELDGQVFEFRMAYHAARGASRVGYPFTPGVGAAMTRGSFWTIEDRRITVEDRKMPRLITSGTLGAAIARREATELAAIDSSEPKKSIRSSLRLGGTAGGDDEVRVTPGEEVHVSAELEALFGRFFELPPFRFDMPIRTDEDYSGLVQSYAERYLYLNRGPTQTAFPRGSASPFAAGRDPDGPAFSVTVPSVVPPSAEASPIATPIGVTAIESESLDFESRLDELLEALGES